MDNILDVLAFKYNTDKRIGAQFHGYTKIYFDLFKDKRDKVDKVMEIGVWKGASLRMWRDYFPLAEVYGLDNHRELLFEADRIKCFFTEQKDEAVLDETVKEIGTGFDLIVDDGSHEVNDQILSFKKFFPLIKAGGIYAIEDVFIENIEKVKEALTDLDYSIFASELDPRSYPGLQTYYYYNLVIIRK